MNDLPVGRSVDETLRLVQAFQYTDKHGEGACFQYFGNGNYVAVLFSLESDFVAIRKRDMLQHLISSWLFVVQSFWFPSFKIQ